MRGRRVGRVVSGCPFQQGVVRLTLITNLYFCFCTPINVAPDLAHLHATRRTPYDASTLFARNVCLVGENPMYSVPTLQGCEGLWSDRLRLCMIMSSRPPPCFSHLSLPRPPTVLCKICFTGKPVTMLLCKFVSPTDPSPSRLPGRTRRWRQ